MELAAVDIESRKICAACVSVAINLDRLDVRKTRGKDIIIGPPRLPRVGRTIPSACSFARPWKFYNSFSPMSYCMNLLRCQFAKKYRNRLTFD